MIAGASWEWERSCCGVIAGELELVLRYKYSDGGNEEGDGRDQEEEPGEIRERLTSIGERQKYTGRRKRDNCLPRRRRGQEQQRPLPLAGPAASTCPQPDPLAEPLAAAGKLGLLEGQLFRGHHEV